MRNEWLIDRLLVNGFHVLCTGETGTGKSVGVKKKLLGGMEDDAEWLFIVRARPNGQGSSDRATAL